MVKSNKIEKTETVKVEWEKKDIIVISQASTDYGLTLHEVRTDKYIYVEGYFSDLIRKKGNYLEVLKTDDKNIVIKGYRDGKLVTENKIMLDDNKETIFSDHTNYYVAPHLKPIRTITSYSKKIIDRSTRLITQESNDITNGAKKLNHKFETLEVSSFDKRSNKKTVTYKTKAILANGPQPDSESKSYETYDSEGRIIKLESSDKYFMTVIYK